MKKIGILLLASLILAGCSTSSQVKEYTCQVDQSYNHITIERNGKFFFPTGASKVQIFFNNNQINVVDFVGYEYMSYPLVKSTEQQRVEKIKDFNVVINKGDFYSDVNGMLEIYSPSQKTIGLYYLAPSTSKLNSIQFLTECERTNFARQGSAHSH